MSRRTADDWRLMVRYATAGVDDATVEKIVAHLLEHPDHGVWHAFALVTGKPCWCAACRPDVKRFA